MTDHLRIADRQLQSRLILGTGGFANHELLAQACRAAETELCTVALRRLDPAARGSILDVLRGRGRRGAAQHRRLLTPPATPSRPPGWPGRRLAPTGSSSR